MARIIERSFVLVNPRFPAPLGLELVTTEDTENTEAFVQEKTPWVVRTMPGTDSGAKGPRVLCALCGGKL
jgi:hypothetical protein